MHTYFPFEYKTSCCKILHCNILTFNTIISSPPSATSSPDTATPTKPTQTLPQKTATCWTCTGYRSASSGRSDEFGSRCSWCTGCRARARTSWLRARTGDSGFCWRRPVTTCGWATPGATYIRGSTFGTTRGTTGGTGRSGGRNKKGGCSWDFKFWLRLAAEKLQQNCLFL